MALLSQALHLGYLLSPHSAFQGHAAHTARWPAMLSPNGSSDTCISDGVFHIPMPCFHGAPPPAHSARLGVAAAGETPCADPAHRLPSPSHGALSHPTRRAFPGTARAVCDTAPPEAHGTPDVVAGPVPTPQAETSGSRARRGRSGRRSP